MVSYFLCVPVAIALHFIMAKENKRRDAAQEDEKEGTSTSTGTHAMDGHQHQVPIALRGKDAEQVTAPTSQGHLDTAFLDLTDKQNRYYRYPL